MANANGFRLKPTSPLVVAPWLAVGVLLALWPRRRPPGMSKALNEPLEAGRGRTARGPLEIPASGWKDVLWRTWREFLRDRVTFVAGGVAFTVVMTLFPTLAAVVSLYGIFADVETARTHLSLLAGLIPEEVLTFVGDQMVRVAGTRQANLSLTFVGSLLLSLWSAIAGTKVMFNGLNVAYEEVEKRSFVKLNLTALAMTLGAWLFILTMATAVIVVPVALNLIRVDPSLLPLALLRWPFLLAITLFALAILYRYGPSRSHAKWRWVTWGSLLASVLLLSLSGAYSWYIGNFGDYNATYGSLAAMFGFLTWIWLSTVIVLVGAELNAEIEHQTAVDSTTAPEQPIGQRGAVMADTVGRAKLGGPVAMLPAFVARRLHRGESSPDQRLAAE